MTVTIGSARIDERGKATGGRAGDQTFDNGWFLVEYGNQNAAVSGKYGRLVE